MRSALQQTPISVDEFLQRSEREDGQFEELIEGQVTASPNAKKRHNHVVSRVERLLMPLDGSRFVVRGEVACRISDYSLPNTDACAVQRARWDAVGNDEFLRESPALVIEVVSPNNQKLRRKAAQYLEHGAEPSHL